MSSPLSVSVLWPTGVSRGMPAFPASLLLWIFCPVGGEPRGRWRPRGLHPTAQVLHEGGGGGMGRADRLQLEDVFLLSSPLVLSLSDTSVSC